MSFVHGLECLILLRCSYYPKRSVDSTVCQNTSFVEIGKCILKRIRNLKGPQIAQTFFLLLFLAFPWPGPVAVRMWIHWTTKEFPAKTILKKNEVCKSHFLISKHCKAIIIKTGWYWHDGAMECNSPEINPCLSSNDFC